MRFPRPSFLALGLGLLLASCTDAASDTGSDPTSAGGSGGAAASGAGGENTAGTSSGAAGQGGGAGNAGAGGSEAGAGGEAGQGGSAGAGAGGAAGDGGTAGAGGEPFGGAAGQSGAAGQPGGNGGTAGSAGGGEPFGGSAGSGGDGGSAAGQSGSAGTGGSSGAGGSSGTSGSGAAPGWTCGEATYKSGGSYPACNCDCGAYDPDCDDPFSHVKGCDKGQTCGKEGTCQGEIAKVPSSWVCGSAYYAIGGPKPVCDCGCGAPDPDCEQPYPTYNLTKCKKGQTCGEDGTCQGPELPVPAAWTCSPSKFAEGKTDGTCDCDCGAYDPDCGDTHLKLLGCGYKQTCDGSGKCAGEIAPAPPGWTCASNTYSDGKICHCEVCGVRDPDCDLDLPDDCGPDAFCGSIKNECIPKAQ